MECQVVDPHLDGFSGNLFAHIIYYFEVGNVGIEMVVRFTVEVKYTGTMTAVFFYFIPIHLLDSPM